MRKLVRFTSMVIWLLLILNCQANANDFKAEVNKFYDNKTVSYESDLCLIGSAMSNLGYIPRDYPCVGYIISGYGYRRDPFSGRSEFHDGVDISNHDPRTHVRATAPGHVIWVGWKQGYGETVIIDHGGKFQTLYGHLAFYSVKVGEWIPKNFVVGYMGSTGKSTGIHVHYQIRMNGRTINPRDMWKLNSKIKNRTF